jgi:two-component system NtrC family response regulator
LDEIGDLSPALQMKLLRFLQEKEFQRVGSNQTMKTDVRVMAATNRDLEEGIRSGTFREDLYYRLNVIAIFLPPLRERRGDIPLLIDHFLQKYSQKNRKAIPKISKETRDLLLRYAYPGNVRELENIIERSLVISRGDIIMTRDLPFQVREGVQEAKLGPDSKEASLNAMLSGMERDLIMKALDEHGGVQTKAAQSLGISERVLRYKMKKYHLST